MPNRNDSIPQTVADVLDDSATFEPAALAAVRALARSKPWRGSVEERLVKFQTCIDALVAAYGLQPIKVVRRDGGRSGMGAGHVSRDREIVYPLNDPWMSVVTLLHLFAALRGSNIFGRFRWSVNLFKRCFPISFARCQQVGPYLTTASRANAYRAELAAINQAADDEAEIRRIEGGQM